MSKKDFHLSKQIFIILSVSLVLFVAGLAWSALSDYHADAWIELEFNRISDRRDADFTAVESGNLYARVHHWGNMVNRCDKENLDIHAWMWGGVAWYDNREATQKYANAPNGGTAIDMGMVANLNGTNNSAHERLMQPGDSVDTEIPDDFFFSTTTHKVVNQGDVQHYWAGAYTTLFFHKGNNGPMSDQEKETIKKWAPNGTEYNQNKTRKPTSGYLTIDMPPQ